MKHCKFSGHLLIVGIALCLARAPDAMAALVDVDSPLGSADADSCTLVNAFAAASSEQPVGTCPAGDGDDVIELPQNSSIALTGASIDYGGSLLTAVTHVGG